MRRRKIALLSVALLIILASLFLRYNKVLAVSANPDFNITLATDSTTTYVFRNDGTLLASNSNPVTMLNTAANYAIGGTMYVSSGTYDALSSHFELRGISNTLIVCAEKTNPAIFTYGPNHNTACFQVWNCNNVTIKNIVVDGNAPNQIQSQTTNCVLVFDSGNVLFDGATLMNARIYGWSSGVNSGVHVSGPCGIINSEVYGCWWNGICLQENGLGNSNGNYAFNNEVYHCSDVGISDWGANNPRIISNHIHDIDMNNGWAGAGTGSHTGIQNEGGSNAEIIDNDVENCDFMGIGSNDQSGHNAANGLIKNNRVSNCGIGIAVDSDVGYNIIAENTVANWKTSGYAYGIFILTPSPNTLVVKNTLTHTSPSVVVDAIRVEGASSCSIIKNTITMPSAATAPSGIRLMSSYSGSGSSNNIIQENTIQSYRGITIADSGCSGNKIIQNSFVCAYSIADSGTGTIVDPSSSSSYSLSFNNPFAAVSTNPAQGIYNYASGDQATITLSGASGYTLNVNGQDMVPSGGTYTLGMTKNICVYVTSTTAAPVPTSPPTPSPSTSTPSPTSTPNSNNSGINENETATPTPATNPNPIHYTFNNLPFDLLIISIVAVGTTVFVSRTKRRR